MAKLKLSLALVQLALLVACGSNADRTEALAPPVPGVMTSTEFAKKYASFGQYWYQGLAELDRYALTQMRYAQPRDGQAVLIFVTEDFRMDRQVKFEGGDKKNVASVLKVNAHRRFDTGIYPYSVLTSSFSSVDKVLQPIKVTGTVQEWCGQTFTQLNQEPGGYNFRLYSYFDTEGDRNENLPASLTEDGLWAAARKDPNSLPLGNVKMLPSIHVLRFRHVAAAAHDAVASLTPVHSSPYGDVAQLRYEVAYASFGRNLQLFIEAEFPHRILAWQETDSTEGEDGPTVAVLKESIMLDYWNRNGNGDTRYREALGLP